MDEPDDMLGGLVAPSPPPESPAQHGVAEYDDLVNGQVTPDISQYPPQETGLEALPNELLQLVLSSLDQEDLANFSRGRSTVREDLGRDAVWANKA